MRVVIGAALLAAPAAQAQEDASPADALLNTQAQVCAFGDVAMFVPLRETADGSLQPLGQWASWQVTQADGDRVTLIRADVFLQMDGPNSLVVEGGALQQGVCADQTLALLDYVAAVIGGEGTEALVAFQDSLLEQVANERQANEELRTQMEDAAESDFQGLRDALETVRARNGELRRELDAAEARLLELEG